MLLALGRMFWGEWCYLHARWLLLVGGDGECYNKAAVGDKLIYLAKFIVYSRNSGWHLIDFQGEFILAINA